MIDPLPPMMRIETLLKEMHNILLKRDLDGAIEMGTILLAETRVLQNTLIILKEKQDALRQQAPTLHERV